MLPENCSTCKHSIAVGVHKEGNINLAECRRYPPTLQIIPNQKGEPMKVSNFPPVNSQMSCGEWAVAILTS